MMSKPLIVAVSAVILISVTSLVVVQLQTATYPYNYFFFRDPDFLNGLGNALIYWQPHTWNFSSPFSSTINIQDGLATLSYNESGGQGWGGAVLLQGSLPHGQGSWRRPLGGKTLAEAKPIDYVTFYRDKSIPRGKYFLELKVMVTERNYTFFGSNTEAVSNVGVDLMFGFDDANYHDPDEWKQVAIHADVIVSRVAWDSLTKTEYHSPVWSGNSPSPYDADYHLTLIRGQITQLNTWYTFQIDLAEIIDTIFRLTGKQTLRYYGAQIYTDGTSTHTTAIFDYVKTILQ